MFSNLTVATKTLASHCIVTLKTGTNFSYDLPRADVKTYFALRFSGAYPIQIKGQKDGTDFVGFEIGLTGPDECEQLIKSLELAAAELRWQAGLPLEEVPYTPTAEETAQDAERRWLAAEVEVLAFLLFHGQRMVLGGPTVWQYLRTQLHQLPPLLSGPIWDLLLEACEREQPLTLTELAERVGGESSALPLLPAYDPALVGQPVEEAPSALRARLDVAIRRYFIAALRGHQLELLTRIADEADLEERKALLGQLRTLESRQAFLVNQVVG